MAAFLCLHTRGNYFKPIEYRHYMEYNNFMYPFTSRIIKHIAPDIWGRIVMSTLCKIYMSI